MYVIADRHDAVFVYAGSYVIRPKSSSSTLICRKSMARTVPSVISISYVRPVRLSVTVRVSPPFVAAPSPPVPVACVSVLIASPESGPRPLSLRLPPPAPGSPEPSAHVGPVLDGPCGVALGKRRRLPGVEAQGYPALGDPIDLGCVDEPRAARRVDDQAVEDVLARVLEDGADMADLDAVRAPHRRAGRQHLVRDGVPVVAQAVMTAVTIAAATRTAVTPMTPRAATAPAGKLGRLRPRKASTTAHAASRPPAM